MNVLFVTGGDAAFFNSLLIFLQSFAERLAGQSLAVCDFGFTPAQGEFLRGLGVLLPRPAELTARGTFCCKASLISFLRAGGRRLEDYDAMVWLDADLTLMQTGIADFQAVIAAMQSVGADAAVCAEPAGRSLGDMIEAFAGKLAPFARLIADAGLSGALPYFSSGLFFCRPHAARLLEHWMDLTLTVAEHPLFEQNCFNVALLARGGAGLALDCEAWQAQGRSLDRVRFVAGPAGGRPAARIGDKNIMTLHTTSPEPEHLLVGNCRITVRDLDLSGPFKLFLPEALRFHQLQLLASFIMAYGERMLQLGICTRAEVAVAGYEFVTL